MHVCSYLSIHNLKGLICHKIQPTNHPSANYIYNGQNDG